MTARQSGLETGCRPKHPPSRRAISRTSQDVTFQSLSVGIPYDSSGPPGLSAIPGKRPLSATPVTRCHWRLQRRSTWMLWQIQVRLRAGLTRFNSSWSQRWSDLQLLFVIIFYRGVLSATKSTRVTLWLWLTIQSQSKCEMSPWQIFFIWIAAENFLSPIIPLGPRLFMKIIIHWNPSDPSGSGIVQSSHTRGPWWSLCSNDCDSNKITSRKKS